LTLFLFPYATRAPRPFKQETINDCFLLPKLKAPRPVLEDLARCSLLPMRSNVPAPPSPINTALSSCNRGGFFRGMAESSVFERERENTQNQFPPWPFPSPGHFFPAPEAAFSVNGAPDQPPLNRWQKETPETEERKQKTEGRESLQRGKNSCCHRAPSATNHRHSGTAHATTILPQLIIFQPHAASPSKKNRNLHLYAGEENSCKALPNTEDSSPSSSQPQQHHQEQSTSSPPPPAAIAISVNNSPVKNRRRKRKQRRTELKKQKRAEREEGKQWDSEGTTERGDHCTQRRTNSWQKKTPEIKRRRTRQKQKGGRKTEPPQHRQRSRQTSDAQPPPRQVILLPPSLLRFVLFPACRTNSVLHVGGWGENNSPPPVLLLGQAGPGPALPFWAGSGPEENIRLCWAEIGLIYFGPRSAQNLWGWVRPGPAHLILYIIYYIVLYYLYMYTCFKTRKKSKRFFKTHLKNMRFFCNFITVFWSISVCIFIM